MFTFNHSEDSNLLLTSGLSYFPQCPSKAQNLVKLYFTQLVRILNHNLKGFTTVQLRPVQLRLWSLSTFSSGYVLFYLFSRFVFHVISVNIVNVILFK